MKTQKLKKIIFNLLFILFNYWSYFCMEEELIFESLFFLRYKYTYAWAGWSTMPSVLSSGLSVTARKWKQRLSLGKREMGAPTPTPCGEFPILGTGYLPPQVAMIITILSNHLPQFSEPSQQAVLGSVCFSYELNSGDSSNVCILLPLYSI